MFTKSSQPHPSDVSTAASVARHGSCGLCWISLRHWVPQCWIQVFAVSPQLLLSLSQGGCHRQLFQCDKRWSFPCVAALIWLCPDWNGLWCGWIDWDESLVWLWWKFGLIVMKVWWISWYRSRGYASVLGESPTDDRDECHFCRGGFEVTVS